MAPDILCIGSVHWDFIGRPDPRRAHAMVPGADLPGRIVRVPGGVALNVAVTLRRFGMRPALLGAVGRDADGEALLRSCDVIGLITDHLHRTDDPTDRYVAVEGPSGLLGAVADARTLEAAGTRILAPLAEGGALTPWRGPVVVDGNVTREFLAGLLASDLLNGADLRLAPASAGKAGRLAPALGHDAAVLYLNLAEARVLAGDDLGDAEAAARRLVEMGAARAVVTDGANPAADGGARGVVSATPREVKVVRSLGSGDAFMAAHIAAEARGEAGEGALALAVEAATDHAAGLA